MSQGSTTITFCDMNVHTCYAFLVSMSVNGSNNKLCTGGEHTYGEI